MKPLASTASPNQQGRAFGPLSNLHNRTRVLEAAKKKILWHYGFCIGRYRGFSAILESMKGNTSQQVIRQPGA